MLDVDIPGFGSLGLEYLVCDFTGTISVDGKMLPMVKAKLNEIAEFLKIFVLTADEFGMAENELKDVLPVKFTSLRVPELILKKRNSLRTLTVRGLSFLVTV